MRGFFPFDYAQGQGQNDNSSCAMENRTCTTVVVNGLTVPRCVCGEMSLDGLRALRAWDLFWAWELLRLRRRPRTLRLRQLLQRRPRRRRLCRLRRARTRSSRCRAIGNSLRARSGLRAFPQPRALRRPIRRRARRLTCRAGCAHSAEGTSAGGDARAADGAGPLHGDACVWQPRPQRHGRQRIHPGG